MNRYEIVLAGLFLALYFSAFSLYHLMVSRVNRRTPPDRRIPHSLSWRHWKRLEKEYPGLYPESTLYQLTLSCTVSFFFLAAAMIAFRLWERLSGK